MGWEEVIKLILAGCFLFVRNCVKHFVRTMSLSPLSKHYK